MYLTIHTVRNKGSFQTQDPLFKVMRLRTLSSLRRKRKLYMIINFKVFFGGSPRVLGNVACGVNGTEWFLYELF